MRNFINKLLVLFMFIAMLLCATFATGIWLSSNVALSAEENGSEPDVCLIDGENETNYASFSEAIANIKDGVTIRFLKDSVVMENFNVKVGFTIDLNGKKINAKGGIIRCSSLTILDSTADKNGTLTIQDSPLQPYEGEVTFESGTVDGEPFLFDYATTINICGANIKTSLYAWEYSTVYLTDGYVKELIYYNEVHISGGVVGKLIAKNNNMTLSGGNINEFALDGGATFKDMLCDGFAYQKADGSAYVKLSEMTTTTAVKIVECPHKTDTNSFNDNNVCEYCGYVCKHDTYDSTGKCTTCDKEIQAKIIDGETETYFTSFKEAVAAAPSRDSGKTVTISLLNDCEFCVFSDKSLIIDLNGKILNSSSTNTVTIESSNITFQDSNTTTGEMTIHGDISFFKCTVHILSGVFTDVSDNDYTDLCMCLNTNATITGGIFNITLTSTYFSNTTIKGNTNSYDLKIANLCVITANSVQISNAYIRKFSIHKIMPMLKDNVFIGEIKFYEIENDYKGILCNGYAYYAADGTGYIKPSDMNETIPTYAKECTHNDFTVNEQNEHVCDYCGYICIHEEYDKTTHQCTLCGDDCPHESYDEKGLCKACSYVCPHDHVDEYNKCDTCQNMMNIKVSNEQGSKYFIALEKAFNSCEDEDYLIILNDMELKATYSINKNITIDLNGKKLLVCFVELNSKSVVIDSVGGGLILVTADFTQNSADIELRGKDNTEFRILKYSLKIKVYSGKITLVLDNNDELHDLLPEGYLFMENGKALLWSEVLKKAVDYNGLANNTALIIQKCEHTDLDENLVCKHCNYTLPTGDAIDRVYNYMELAKNELQAAIDQRADAATINTKINQLNEAIQNAEKARSDSDEALSSALSTQIEEAKQLAIGSANTALETAKKELNIAINEKASTNDLNEAINTLNTAIANAQSISIAYADEKDGALKDSLTNSIETAKADVIKLSKEALAEATETLTNKINEKANANDLNEAINTLNTAIANAQSISVAYADEKDGALKDSLTNSIETAKADVIKSSKEALAEATETLTNKINEKANANDLNEAIKTLNTAITNAQSINNAYVDEKDQALKTELEGKIEQAQNEISEAINALSIKLEKVENKTNTLQTVLIVFIVLFSLCNIATFTIIVLRKRN